MNNADGDVATDDVVVTGLAAASEDTRVNQDDDVDDDVDEGDGADMIAVLGQYGKSSAAQSWTRAEATLIKGKEPYS